MTIQIPTSQHGTGLTSTSLERAPAPLQSFVRGKSGHVPFWPGGLDAALLPSNTSDSTPKGLRTVPPGFSRGLNIGGVEVDGDEISNLDADGRDSIRPNEVSINYAL